MVIRLKDAVGAFTSKVSVVGAYYDIASGQVEWLADRIARGLPLGLMRMQRPGQTLGRRIIKGGVHRSR